MVRDLPAQGPVLFMQPSYLRISVWKKIYFFIHSSFCNKMVLNEI
jgi:trehalose-6-phosphate synthase